GLFMDYFRSPLHIPSELKKSMERFLAQFWFPIPTNDMELLLFYFLPFYPKAETLLENPSGEIIETRGILTKYLQNLQEKTDIVLKNKEDLVNQLTVQYVYKSLFQGISFLMGPTMRMDFLGSLGPQYKPFISEAYALLREEFAGKLEMKTD